MPELLDADLADFAGGTEALLLALQNSMEAERLAVSREVHDQLGAALTGMRMQLEALAHRAQQGADVHAAELLALAHTARTTQLAARDICSRLRPLELEDLGLVQACRLYVRDWSAQVGIAVRGRFARLPQQPDGRVAADLFRVMQELLTNVARHARASQVRVSLRAGPRSVSLRVQDDGCGLAPEAIRPGLGLLGMRERVRLHGGDFQLQSQPGGTTVTVRMPLAPTP